MADTTQRIACKAVIRVNGKVLLLREAPTYEESTQVARWSFPGGRIDPGEPFLEGLKREIMEEAGLKIISAEPFYVGEWFPVIKEAQHQIVAIFFACELSPECHADGVRLSSEHDEYRWISLTDTESIDFMPPDDDVFATYTAKCPQ